MLEQLGGRKFLMSLIVIAVGTLVQIISPHGVTEAFTALLIGVAATFGATNAIISSRAMGAAEAAATQPVPIDLALRSTVDSVSSIVRTLAQRSDETQAKIDEQAATLATLQQNAEVTSKLVKAALTTRTST